MPSLRTRTGILRTKEGELLIAYTTNFSSLPIPKGSAVFFLHDKRDYTPSSSNLRVSAIKIWYASREAASIRMVSPISGVKI